MSLFSCTGILNKERERRKSPSFHTQCSLGLEGVKPELATLEKVSQ